MAERRAISARSETREKFEVQSSRLSELRTWNFELRIARFPPVSPVSLALCRLWEFTLTPHRVSDSSHMQ